MKVGIFHTAFIGDIVLCGLLIEALYKAGHQIVFFTKAQTALIYENDLRVQKVVGIQKKSGVKKIFAVKTIAKQIQQEECDVLLVPHRSATSSLCAKLSRVPVTIGFKNAHLSSLYKIQVPFCKEKHECARYLDLASEGLVKKNEILEYEKNARPILQYTKNAFDDFDTKFDNLDILKRNFFIIAPGSVWATKKYPIASWVQVAIGCLEKNPNSFCALCGSISDQKEISEFKSLFEKKSTELNLNSKLRFRLIDTSKMFNLAEFAIFISKAKFVLSNDSSPTHFASAFNIPVITIFGPTVPAFGFGPTSEKHKSVVFLDSKNNPISCQPCSIHGQNKCPLVHHRCMKDLKPDTVIKEIDLMRS